MPDLDVSAAFLVEVATRLGATAALPAFGDVVRAPSSDQTGSPEVTVAITASQSIRVRLNDLVRDHMIGLGSDVQQAQVDYGYADDSLAGQIP